MARKITLIIGNNTYQTQSMALNFFKEMLNRYIPSEIVSETDSFHLKHLFERHPNYIEKIGSGIDHFEVMAADFHSQCFCVIRADGSKEGFSYKRCITQKTD